MRPIVFIAGRLRHPDPRQMAANVLTARHYAMEIAKLGCAPYCPHAAIGFAFRQIPEADANATNNTFLFLAHALFALPYAERSLGARRELKVAVQRGLPVFHRLEDLQAWRRSQ